jgi:hypothetical protein
MQVDLKVWLDHFEYHANHRSVLPEGRPDELTAYEGRLIADSIATFQLGEQSEGRSLLRAAEDYEREQEHDAPSLARIVRLFIAEEQHHASLLAEFMQQHGIPRKRSDWTDYVFRTVRKLAGLELQISVLITAELIGKVYYRALEAATGCRQLQVLCRMLVADELAHVGFESDLLLAMRARKSNTTQRVMDTLHRLFFTGASLVVWMTHRPVLRAAGYRLGTFMRACAAQYDFYLVPAPRLGSTSAAKLSR